MVLPLKNSDERFTYKDYLYWPEGERWELIDGVPYLMSPPARLHQEVSGELFRQIANYLVGKDCKVYSAPFGVKLPKGDEKEEGDIDTVVEPDITVVCDKSKLDDKGCKGAPDLIIEITSPSSGRRDKLEKFNKYEAAGVKEYWIVEPEQKLVSVFTLGADGRYGRPDIYDENDSIKVSIFEHLTVDLKLVF